MKKTIEQWAAELGIPEWQLAGLKHHRGWGEGKEVTEAEFKSALSKWLNGPVNAAQAKDVK
jgi:hypothetical protein